MNLLDILGVFNWITPLVGFAEDFANDPTLLQTGSWTFFIPYKKSLSVGYNGRDIKGLLAKHGILTWGHQITGGEYLFSVPLEQARLAEYVLTTNNVPLKDTT